MRTLFFSLLILNSILVFSQNKYFTRTGNIWFISRTDAVDIEGENNQVVSFINTKTGDIVFGVLMSAFEFPLATAEEHFNESYAETHKFPKGKFKGKILDFENIDFHKNGNYNVIINGLLTIHGETKPVEHKGVLKIEDNKIIASSTFNIKIEDYKISVPKLLRDKVAEIVEIKVNMEYIPFNK